METKPKERVVPASAVQGYLDEMEGWTQRDIDAANEGAVQEQRELMAFVSHNAIKAGPARRSQTITTLVLVIGMFEKHFGSKCRPISDDDITNHLDRGDPEYFAWCRSDRKKPFEYKQPFLMSFVMQTVFQDPTLGANDANLLTFLLKNAVDMLDAAYTQPDR